MEQQERAENIGDNGQGNERPATQSRTIGILAGALAKAQGQMKNAAKDAANPFLEKKYSDLASIWDACRIPLSSNGLAIIQTTKNDSRSITVTTILAHESGEWISGSLTLAPSKPDPQGFLSALTYGRRGALAAIVGVSSSNEESNPPAQNLPRSTPQNYQKKEPVNKPATPPPAEPTPTEPPLVQTPENEETLSRRAEAALRLIGFVDTQATDILTFFKTSKKLPDLIGELNLLRLSKKNNKLDEVELGKKNLIECARGAVCQK